MIYGFFYFNQTFFCTKELSICHKLKFFNPYILKV